MLDRSDRHFSAWNDGPAHLGVSLHVSKVEQVVAQNFVVRYIRGAKAQQRLWLALHRGIGRLPLAERLPVIHCGLQGRPVGAVADLLTLDRGAVRAGLVRGQLLLCRMLARQGLSVSAPEVGRLLRREAGFGAVPERLLADTIRLGTGPREQLPAPVDKLANLALLTL